MSQGIRVLSAPLPFHAHTVERRVDNGCTLSEIVEQVTGYPVDSVTAVVMIEGVPIPRENWHKIRPKSHTLVNVRVVPHGGGGKKNPIASLLSIAVMVAAPYAVAGLGFTTLGTSAASLTLSGRLVAGGLGMLGGLLVSAIAPPPQQRSNGNGVVNAVESQTQFIQGASNKIDPYGVLPFGLGTNRVFPNQIALPYTESVDNKQYVRQLFAWGLNDKVTLNDIRIGETSITEFDGVDIEHRLEGNLHTGTTLYAKDVLQTDYNVLLKQIDGYTTRTTEPNSNEAVLDVTFPRGLSEFTSEGQRISRQVELEVQFSPTGAGTWSNGGISYKPIALQSLSLATLGADYQEPLSLINFIAWRRDMVVLNVQTGVASIVQGQSAQLEVSAVVSALPQNHLRLATALVKSYRARLSPTDTVTVESFTNDRQAANVGKEIELATDFAATNPSGLSVSVAAGGIRFMGISITAATTEAVRKSVRMTFPSAGQYDIRIRRLTGDTASDQIFDEVFLTAIKSINNQSPVQMQGVSGSAIRILGTDQLNGSIQQLNANMTAHILDYAEDLDTWVVRATSNPASIFRHVLQGSVNPLPAADNEINIAKLEEWHDDCRLKGLTYNNYIDYETSIEQLLHDIAAAGHARYLVIDGVKTVSIDNEKPQIAAVVTADNSWGFSADLQYPDLPHGLRVNFRNATKDYLTDEVIVYDNGYTAANATKFETLELPACTNADLAWKYGRRYLAEGRLRPEMFSFYQDVQHLVYTHGDRIKFSHNVPLVTSGSGRVKSVTDNGTNITTVTLDDIFEIQSGKSYFARIQNNVYQMFYVPITASIGEEIKTFSLGSAVAIGSFLVGDIAYVVEAGGELDLVISAIEPQADMSAKIRAVNYAPEIFTASTGDIPPFDSNITTPISFKKPNAPILVAIQSDESVLIRNSDGSITSRAIINLRNTNSGEVRTSVKARLTGTTEFTNAELLQATDSLAVLSGLDDGKRYDIEIRYVRTGTNLLSNALTINNYRFIGASAIPADVDNFRINVTGEVALLEWQPNTDIDISHYEIRFSRAFSGATWITSQILRANVKANNIAVPFIGGTYTIKAVDFLGNYSANATAIITYNPAAIRNVISTITESPSYLGAKDNCVKVAAGLQLSDTSQIGYYYFQNTFDLGAVFESYISADVVASGITLFDIYGSPDLYAEADLYSGSLTNNLYASADLYAEEDLYGIGLGKWAVTLQYRITQDFDAGVPVWTDWQELQAGLYSFEAIEFRLQMVSYQANVTPNVTKLEVVIDMPDRIERGNDLSVPIGGATITYSTPFKDNPSVSINIQDGAVDDRIEFTSKTASGFTFKVFNATASGYVARTYDYITVGYGRG